MHRVHPPLDPPLISNALLVVGMSMNLIFCNNVDFIHVGPHSSLIMHVSQVTLTLFFFSSLTIEYDSTFME